MGKPVFAAVAQNKGRQCARRCKHISLQPVQDAEIVEVARVSIYQQYIGCDASRAHFPHKTLLCELVFACVPAGQKNQQCFGLGAQMARSSCVAIDTVAARNKPQPPNNSLPRRGLW